MMISPGYAYEKAPDQVNFLSTKSSTKLFADAFADGRRKHWRLNHSPLFLDFLEGKVDFECTPWGIPSYSVFGWQRPCYLMADGYTETYQELLDTTDWDQVRPGQGPALRQLHGPLRLRAERRHGHDQVVQAVASGPPSGHDGPRPARSPSGAGGPWSPGPRAGSGRPRPGPWPPTACPWPWPVATPPPWRPSPPRPGGRRSPAT